MPEEWGCLPLPNFTLYGGSTDPKVWAYTLHVELCVCVLLLDVVCCLTFYLLLAAYSLQISGEKEKKLKLKIK